MSTPFITTVPGPAVHESPPAAPTPPAPPLENWLSGKLLTMIRTAPTNPAIRGTIRNELKIVPPLDLFVTPTTGAIESYLRNNYMETAAGQRDKAEALLVAAEKARQDAAAAEQLRRSVRRNADGSITVDRISGSGEETVHSNVGKCRWRAQVEMVRVPAEIVSQGAAAVHQYLHDRLVAQGVENDNADTDDYRWTDVVRDSLTLTDCSFSTERLELALRNP